MQLIPLSSPNQTSRTPAGSVCRFPQAPGQTSQSQSLLPQIHSESKTVGFFLSPPKQSPSFSQEEQIFPLKTWGVFLPQTPFQEEKIWKWSQQWGAQYTVEKTQFRRAVCEKAQLPVQGQAPGVNAAKPNLITLPACRLIVAGGELLGVEFGVFWIFFGPQGEGLFLAFVGGFWLRP